MVTRFTGYGRGWSEERAKTRVGRLFQRLREPATTPDYIIAFGITGVVLIVIMVIA